MLRKKNFKQILLPVLALNLVPLIAAGKGPARHSIRKPAGDPVAAQAAAPAAQPVVVAEPAPQPKFRGLNDLTASELNSTFRNFDISLEGRDPNTRAILYGMVFNDCKKNFTIVNTNTDATLRSSGSVGFRITDQNGAGRDCMAKHKSDACSDDTPCTRLSQLQGANLDLSNMGDVQIQLMHVDPDRDRDQNQWEDFKSDKLAHVSGTTIKAQRDAEEKARKAEIVKILQKQVASCRKNDADRDTARAAADTLQSMGLMSDDDVAKLQKQLAGLELNDLGRQFLKTQLKDEEGTQEVMEKLKAFEADHPESADGIAVLMYQKALAYTKDAKDADAYDKASSMIAEAQGLDGLNDVAADRLQNYQRDIAVGRFQVMAKSGSTDPYAFWQPYQSFMWDLQTGMQTCAGPQMQSEDCRSMMNAYRSASQIPQQAQQAEYERYMFYMKMQQQYAQFAGGSFMNTGMQTGGASQGSGFYR